MDGAVGVCEGLKAFEAGLAVVEGGCAHVDVDGWVLTKLQFTPFSILVRYPQITLGRTEFKTE